MAEAKKQTKKKAGLGQRIKKWYRGMVAELKKVVWPTKEQVLKNSGIVLLCILIVGVFIWVFDWAGNTIVQWLINITH